MKPTIQPPPKSGLNVYLGANIIFFSALLLAKFFLSITPEPSVGLLLSFSCLLFVAGISIGLLAAPLGFWRWLLEPAPIEIAVAFAGASFAVVGGYFAQEGWDSLSGATLSLSHWLLTLYEPNVLLDVRNRILGANFSGSDPRAPARVTKVWRSFSRFCRSTCGPFVAICGFQTRCCCFPFALRRSGF